MREQIEEKKNNADKVKNKTRRRNVIQLHITFLLYIVY